MSSLSSANDARFSISFKPELTERDSRPAKENNAGFSAAMEVPRSQKIDYICRPETDTVH
jgi:hypothetical protein